MTASNDPSGFDDVEKEEFFNSFSTREDRKNLRYKHLHSFKAVTLSKYSDKFYMRWIESCRCGASVVVEHFFEIKAGKPARKKKSWFSRFGKLLKVTGDYDGTE